MHKQLIMLLALKEHFNNDSFLSLLEDQDMIKYLASAGLGSDKVSQLKMALNSAKDDEGLEIFQKITKFLVETEKVQDFEDRRKSFTLYGYSQPVLGATLCQDVRLRSVTTITRHPVPKDAAFPEGEVLSGYHLITPRYGIEVKFSDKESLKNILKLLNRTPTSSFYCNQFIVIENIDDVMVDVDMIIFIDDYTDIDSKIDSLVITEGQQCVLSFLSPVSLDYLLENWRMVYQESDVAQQYHQVYYYPILEISESEVDGFRELVGAPWQSFEPTAEELLLVNENYFYEYLAIDVMFNLVNPAAIIKTARISNDNLNTLMQHRVMQGDHAWLNENRHVFNYLDPHTFMPITVVWSSTETIKVKAKKDITWTETTDSVPFYVTAFMSRAVQPYITSEVSFDGGLRLGAYDLAKEVVKPEKHAKDKIGHYFDKYKIQLAIEHEFATGMLAKNKDLEETMAKLNSVKHAELKELRKMLEGLKLRDPEKQKQQQYLLDHFKSSPTQTIVDKTRLFCNNLLENKIEKINRDFEIKESEYRNELEQCVPDIPFVNRFLDLPLAEIETFVENHRYLADRIVRTAEVKNKHYPAFTRQDVSYLYSEEMFPAWEVKTQNHSVYHQKAYFYFQIDESNGLGIGPLDGLEVNPEMKTEVNPEVAYLSRQDFLDRLNKLNINQMRNAIENTPNNSITVWRTLAVEPIEQIISINITGPNYALRERLGKSTNFVEIKSLSRRAIQVLHTRVMKRLEQRLIDACQFFCQSIKNYVAVQGAGVNGNDVNILSRLKTVAQDKFDTTMLHEAKLMVQKNPLSKNIQDRLKNSDTYLHKFLMALKDQGTPVRHPDLVAQALEQGFPEVVPFYTGQFEWMLFNSCLGLVINTQDAYQAGLILSRYLETNATDRRVLTSQLTADNIQYNEGFINNLENRNTHQIAQHIVARQLERDVLERYQSFQEFIDRVGLEGHKLLREVDHLPDTIREVFLVEADRLINHDYTLSDYLRQHLQVYLDPTQSHLTVMPDSHCHLIKISHTHEYQPSMPKEVEIPNLGFRIKLGLVQDGRDTGMIQRVHTHQWKLMGFRISYSESRYGKIFRVLTDLFEKHIGYGLTKIEAWPQRIQVTNVVRQDDEVAFDLILAAGVNQPLSLDGQPLLGLPTRVQSDNIVLEPRIFTYNYVRNSHQLIPKEADPIPVSQGKAWIAFSSLEEAQQLVINDEVIESYRVPYLTPDGPLLHFYTVTVAPRITVSRPFPGVKDTIPGFEEACGEMKRRSEKAINSVYIGVNACKESVMRILNKFLDIRNDTVNANQKAQKQITNLINIFMAWLASHHPLFRPMDDENSTFYKIIVGLNPKGTFNFEEYFKTTRFPPNCVDDASKINYAKQKFSEWIAEPFSYLSQSTQTCANGLDVFFNILLKLPPPQGSTVLINKFKPIPNLESELSNLTGYIQRVYESTRQAIVEGAHEVLSGVVQQLNSLIPKDREYFQRGLTVLNRLSEYVMWQPPRTISTTSMRIISFQPLETSEMFGETKYYGAVYSWNAELGFALYWNACRISEITTTSLIDIPQLPEPSAHEPVEQRLIKISGDYLETSVSLNQSFDQYQIEMALKEVDTGNYAYHTDMTNSAETTTRMTRPKIMPGVETWNTLFTQSLSLAKYRHGGRFYHSIDPQGRYFAILQPNQVLVFINQGGNFIMTPQVYRHSQVSQVIFQNPDLMITIQTQDATQPYAMVWSLDHDRPLSVVQHQEFALGMPIRKTGRISIIESIWQNTGFELKTEGATFIRDPNLMVFSPDGSRLLMANPTQVSHHPAIYDTNTGEATLLRKEDGEPLNPQWISGAAWSDTQAMSIMMPVNLEFASGQAVNNTLQVWYGPDHPQVSTYLPTEITSSIYTPEFIDVNKTEDIITKVGKMYDSLTSLGLTNIHWRYDKLVFNIGTLRFVRGAEGADLLTDQVPQIKRWTPEEVANLGPENREAKVTGLRANLYLPMEITPEGTQFFTKSGSIITAVSYSDTTTQIDAYANGVHLHFTIEARVTVEPRHDGLHIEHSEGIRVKRGRCLKNPKAHQILSYTESNTVSPPDTIFQASLTVHPAEEYEVNLDDTLINNSYKPSLTTAYLLRCILNQETPTWHPCMRRRKLVFEEQPGLVRGSHLILINRQDDSYIFPAYIWERISLRDHLSKILPGLKAQADRERCERLNQENMDMKEMESVGDEDLVKDQEEKGPSDKETLYAEAWNLHRYLVIHKRVELDTSDGFELILKRLHLNEVPLNGELSSMVTENLSHLTTLIQQTEGPVYLKLKHSDNGVPHGTQTTLPLSLVEDRGDLKWNTGEINVIQIGLFERPFDTQTQPWSVSGLIRHPSDQPYVFYGTSFQSKFKRSVKLLPRPTSRLSTRSSRNITGETKESALFNPEAETRMPLFLTLGGVINCSYGGGLRSQTWCHGNISCLVYTGYSGAIWRSKADTTFNKGMNSIGNKSRNRIKTENIVRQHHEITKGRFITIIWSVDDTVKMMTFRQNTKEVEQEEKELQEVEYSRKQRIRGITTRNKDTENSISRINEDAVTESHNVRDNYELKKVNFYVRLSEGINIIVSNNRNRSYTFEVSSGSINYSNDNLVTEEFEFDQNLVQRRVFHPAEVDYSQGYFVVWQNHSCKDNSVQECGSLIRVFKENNLMSEYNLPMFMTHRVSVVPNRYKTYLRVYGYGETFPLRGFRIGQLRLKPGFRLVTSFDSENPVNLDQRLRIDQLNLKYCHTKLLVASSFAPTATVSLKSQDSNETINLLHLGGVLQDRQLRLSKIPTHISSSPLGGLVCVNYGFSGTTDVFSIRGHLLHSLKEELFYTPTTVPQIEPISQENVSNSLGELMDVAIKGLIRITDINLDQESLILETVLGKMSPSEWKSKPGYHNFDAVKVSKEGEGLRLTQQELKLLSPEYDQTSVEMTISKQNLRDIIADLFNRNTNFTPPTTQQEATEQRQKINRYLKTLKEDLLRHPDTPILEMSRHPDSIPAQGWSEIIRNNILASLATIPGSEDLDFLMDPQTIISLNFDRSRHTFWGSHLASITGRRVWKVIEDHLAASEEIEAVRSEVQYAFLSKELEYVSLIEGKMIASRKKEETNVKTFQKRLNLIDKLVKLFKEKKEQKRIAQSANMMAYLESQLPSDLSLTENERDLLTQNISDLLNLAESSLGVDHSNFEKVLGYKDTSLKLSNSKTRIKGLSEAVLNIQTEKSSIKKKMEYSTEVVQARSNLLDYTIKTGMINRKTDKPTKKTKATKPPRTQRSESTVMAPAGTSYFSTGQLVQPTLKLTRRNMGVFNTEFDLQMLSDISGQL